MAVEPRVRFSQFSPNGQIGFLMLAACSLGLCQRYRAVLLSLWIAGIAHICVTLLTSPKPKLSCAIPQRRAPRRPRSRFPLERGRSLLGRQGEALTEV
jgi:hypothetical protein